VEKSCLFVKAVKSPYCGMNLMLFSGMRRNIITACCGQVRSYELQ